MLEASACLQTIPIDATLLSTRAFYFRICNSLIRLLRQPLTLPYADYSRYRCHSLWYDIYFSRYLDGLDTAVKIERS